VEQETPHQQPPVKEIMVAQDYLAAAAVVLVAVLAR
jgi:hypothetical protein